MDKSRLIVLFSKGMWALTLLFGLFSVLLYSTLPVDGATGDLYSFTLNGFRVQWLIVERAAGLIPGDIIERAGGNTIDEWLSGAQRGDEWATDNQVRYEIVRSGHSLVLPITMTPISPWEFFLHWWAQYLVGLSLIVTGGIVFWRRPFDLAARLFMLFCLAIAWQNFGDAFNFQYAILTRRWLFWLQFASEFGSFMLIYSLVLHFVLVFPTTNPILARRPGLTLFFVYGVHPLVVVLAMVVSPTWTRAIQAANVASWVAGISQGLAAITVGVYSYRTAKDPITRAQMRWLLFGAASVLALAIPGYIIPLFFYNSTLISHPFAIIMPGAIMVIFAAPILRYRLFDIDLVVNRTMLYTTLTVLLVGLYISSVWILTRVAQMWLPLQNETIVAILASLVLALAFNPLRMRVQRVIDRAFFRHKIDYAQILNSILVDMVNRPTASISTIELQRMMSDEIPEKLSIRKACLLILDREGQKLLDLDDSHDHELDIDHPLVTNALIIRKPLNRLFIREFSSPEAWEWLKSHDIELCIPLFAGEHFVGLYNLAGKQSNEPYNSDEVRQLNRLAQQVGLSVHNTRLLQAEKEQRKRAEALAEESARLLFESHKRAAQYESLNTIIAIAVAAPDLEHLLTNVLKLTLHAFQCSAGCLIISDREVIQGMPEDFASAMSQRLSEPGLYGANTVVVPDWGALDENPKDRLLQGWRDPMEQHGIRATMVVPVMVSGQHSGVIAIGSAKPRDWNDEDIGQLWAVVRQLSGAVERLQLLTRSQSQTRLVQQIIETVPEGVLVLDHQRQVILANPAARDYLQVLSGNDQEGEIDKLGGEPIANFLDADPNHPAHEVTIEAERRRIFDVAAREFKADSDDRGWVLVLRDITEDRQAQAQIQIQERLATVGQLAAGIAHDFNNIMAAIQVYADLLAIDPQIQKTGRERVAVIQEQVQRATSLVQQILDFSRRSVMARSSLDLLPFMKELEKLMQRVLPENIRLELSADDEQYLIEADPTRLQQMFMNLSVNARDAMPTGGSLRFELSRFVHREGLRPPVADLKPGDWVRVRVSDTGSGIPPEYVSRIFDPFFTTKSYGRGTGLGLAQVYGIVKQHDGSIDVVSQLGAGTTFTIYLPANEPEDEPPPELIADQHLRGHKESLLLVEDETATREALRILLENLDYRVVEACNGRDAIEVFRDVNGFVDLVISDIVMPEMDGIPMYEELIRMAPNTRILFISGHPIADEKPISAENEQVYWLNKPFTTEKIASLIRQILD